MTNLNIEEYDLVADVRTINEEVCKEEKEKSGFLFFGNIDASMREIDAAIRKLEQLSAKREALVLSRI